MHGSVPGNFPGTDFFVQVRMNSDAVKKLDCAVGGYVRWLLAESAGG